MWKSWWEKSKRGAIYRTHSPLTNLSFLHSASWRKVWCIMTHGSVKLAVTLNIFKNSASTVTTHVMVRHDGLAVYWRFVRTLEWFVVTNPLLDFFRVVRHDACYCASWRTVQRCSLWAVVRQDAWYCASWRYAAQGTHFPWCAMTHDILRHDAKLGKTEYGL